MIYRFRLLSTWLGWSDGHSRILTWCRVQSSRGDFAFYLLSRFIPLCPFHLRTHFIICINNNISIRQMFTLFYLSTHSINLFKILKHIFVCTWVSFENDEVMKIITIIKMFALVHQNEIFKQMNEHLNYSSALNCV